jgi:hypothetical protein
VLTLICAASQKSRAAIALAIAMPFRRRNTVLGADA